MKKILLSLFSLATIATVAQDYSLSNVQLPEMVQNRDRVTIELPDIMGYQTLRCDFHIHTVFSDGTVWPTIRVDEAWKEGLDVIAITEHVEYTSYVHEEDRNKPYEIAKPKADECGLMLIRAGEITRSMPPGHLNAIFIDDVNRIRQPEAIDALKEAKKMDAFIMWNHPGWRAQQPDTCLWMPMHEELYQSGMMHGIEVFNEKEWYPIALDWCLEKGLAPMATSDIHGVLEYMYDLHHAPRPMTLVFAAEKSEKGVKEALMEARTVAMFNNMLAGDPKYLDAIFQSSLTITKVGVDSKDPKKKIYEVKNSSDIPFTVQGDLNFTVPAGKAIRIKQEASTYGVTVKNLWTGSRSQLKTKIKLKN